jgi:hypothetical protein
MLESWLLAHHKALARFLNVSVDLIPRDPDGEEHPKRTLVNLARRSRTRSIREDLIPEAGSSGVVGKNYTARLTEFIRDPWEPLVAQDRSPSLRRALAALKRELEL